MKSIFFNLYKYIVGHFTVIYFILEKFNRNYKLRLLTSL